MASAQKVSVQSGTKSFRNIIDVLKETKYFKNTKPYIVHRLDKETSGVLLLSKHADAYSHAAQAFEKRTIKKIYHAISHGNHSYDDFKVDLPLVTTRSGRSAVNKQKGKPSQTSFTTLENFVHFIFLRDQN